MPAPYFAHASDDDDQIPPLLALDDSVGDGAANGSDDVFAADTALRAAKVYEPPAPYDQAPARYIHGPMVDGIRQLQEQNGLNPSGRIARGDETERALNNRLLNKPKGVGLLYEPIARIAAPVGSGKESRREDVVAVKRALGALGHRPEHPFDRPSPFIDEISDKAIRDFQKSQGLREDGWLGQGGETENALFAALGTLAAASKPDWFAYTHRAAQAQYRLERDPKRNRVNIVRVDDEEAAPPGGDDSDTDRGGEARAPWQTLAFDPNAEDGARAILARYVPPSSTGTATAPSAPVPGHINPLHRHIPFPQLPMPRISPEKPWPDPVPAPKKQPGPDFHDPVIRPDGERNYFEQSHDKALRHGHIHPRSAFDGRYLYQRDPDHWTYQRDWRDATGFDAPGWHSYTPESGDPLAIPLTQYNPYGRPGHPRVQDQNRELAKRVAKMCEAVIPEARIDVVGGPGSELTKEFFSHYDRRHKRSEEREGGSFADATVVIRLGDIYINMHVDTHSSNKDGNPTAGEERRFARLEYNEQDRNRIHVRMPKLKENEEIDLDALERFASDLCKRAKDGLRDGRFGKEGKDVDKIVEFFKAKRPKTSTNDTKSEK